jgi:hypothetical protein
LTAAGRARIPAGATLALLGVLVACGERGEAPAPAAVDSAPAAPIVPDSGSFVEAFRSAHGAGSVDGLVALHHLDGVNGQHRVGTADELRARLAEPIQSITLVSPPVPRPFTFAHEGVTYAMNLPVTHDLVVVYDTATGRRTHYPVGRTPLGYRIAVMVRQ